ncbi:hypothetical protein PENSPDRAFT_356981 [Peniophora sp. CONT]|nr:hypothetical protein PENSPDRAFT_356981 [Peniophora sp. CONT]
MVVRVRVRRVHRDRCAGRGRGHRGKVCACFCDATKEKQRAREQLDNLRASLEGHQDLQCRDNEDGQPRDAREEDVKDEERQAYQRAEDRQHGHAISNSESKGPLKIC